MKTLLNELQTLVSKYEHGTRDEQRAAIVLASLRGALQGGYFETIQSLR